MRTYKMQFRIKAFLLCAILLLVAVYIALLLVGNASKGLSVRQHMDRIGLTGELIYEYNYARYGAVGVVYNENDHTVCFINLNLKHFLDFNLLPSYYTLSGISKVSLDDMTLLLSESLDEMNNCNEYYEDVQEIMVYSIEFFSPYMANGSTLFKYVKVGVLNDNIAFKTAELKFSKEYGDKMVFCVVQEQQGIDPLVSSK